MTQRRGRGETLTLPARGTPLSNRWEALFTSFLSFGGGVIMLIVSLVVPQGTLMRGCGVASLVLGVVTLCLPGTAPLWVRSGYNIYAIFLCTTATAAAEAGTELKLGVVVVGAAILTIAGMRTPKEVLIQTIIALSVYAGYLLVTVPPTFAIVGMVANSVVMGSMAVLLCLLRGRLDDVVRRLEREASTDPLTGLLNRAGLRQAVQEAPSTSCALMLIDVDHFKHINDRLGHEQGDAALVWLADALTTSVPTPGVAGRHGGEEFVVVIPGDYEGHVLHAHAERVRSHVEAHSPTTGIAMTVSIGAVTGDITDLDGLFRAADLALYEVKHNGRNHVRVTTVDAARPPGPAPPRSDAGVPAPRLASAAPAAEPPHASRL